MNEPAGTYLIDILRKFTPAEQLDRALQALERTLDGPPYPGRMLRVRAQVAEVAQAWERVKEHGHG